MSKFLRSFVFVTIAFSFLLAACGTVATPAATTAPAMTQLLVRLRFLPPRRRLRRLLQALLRLMVRAALSRPPPRANMPLLSAG